MNWGVTDNQQCVLCNGVLSQVNIFFLLVITLKTYDIWTQLLCWQGITRDQLALDKRSLSGPTEMHEEKEQQPLSFE